MARVVRVCRAIASTRAPPNPREANSAVAARRMSARLLSGFLGLRNADDLALDGATVLSPSTRHCAPGIGGLTKLTVLLDSSPAELTVLLVTRPFDRLVHVARIVCLEKTMEERL